MASLPRNQDTNCAFTFKLGQPNSLPTYVYKPGMIQKSLNEKMMYFFIVKNFKITFIIIWADNSNKMDRY